MDKTEMIWIAIWASILALVIGGGVYFESRAKKTKKPVPVQKKEEIKKIPIEG